MQQRGCAASEAKVPDRADVRRSATLLLTGAILLALALATGSAARAQTQSQPARTAVGPAASLLPTQAEKERFHRLAEELRCLVCQNQTLADSDAELAADLRREVEHLMLSGRSDDEIKAWLVDRYGDFVLYRPPLQRNTWLLWLGPFLLLAGGALLWWRVAARPATRNTAARPDSRSRAAPAGADERPPTRREAMRSADAKDSAAAATGADGEADAAAAARARQLLDDEA